jgi:hypothetical protein
VRDRVLLLTGTCAALAVLLAHASLFRFVIDDAYISLRFAQNLVEGHGLVFNPGEPVEGYSNLLWVLLGAAGLKLGLPALVWLRVLGSVAAAGVLLLAPGLVRRLTPDADASPLAGPAAQLLVALTGAVACWTWAGLETPLFALLVLLGWRAALDRAPLTAGAAGVLLTITRPEGVAVGGLFLLWAMLAAPDRRRALAGAAVFAGGVAAFFLWRHAVYGSWLPNTYYAKTGDAAGQLKTGLPYTGDFLLRYGLPLAATGLAAGWRGARGLPVRRTLLPTAGVLLFWTAYVTVIGGDMLGMFRFWVPVLPMLVIAAVAMAAAAGWLRRPPWAGALVVVLGAVLLVSSFQGRERRLVAIHMSEANLGGWMLAGDAMARLLPADATVALGPAGYIPWKTGMRTLDFYGIVTPHIAHRDVDFGHGYAGHEKTDGPWIVRQQPDYILIGNVDITDGPRSGLIPPLDREVDLVLDKRFQREYELVNLPVGGGKYLNLFRRREGTAPGP